MDPFRSPPGEDEIPPAPRPTPRALRSLQWERASTAPPARRSLRLLAARLTAEWEPEGTASLTLPLLPDSPDARWPGM